MGDGHWTPGSAAGLQDLGTAARQWRNLHFRGLRPADPAAARADLGAASAADLADLQTALAVLAARLDALENP